MEGHLKTERNIKEHLENAVKIMNNGAEIRKNGGSVTKNENDDTKTIPRCTSLQCCNLSVIMPEELMFLTTYRRKEER
jgi:hypothetical protein